MKTSLFTLLIILCNHNFTENSSTGNWGYVTTNNTVGPSEWSTIYPSCAGNRQSPINIQTKYAKYLPNMLPISIEKLIDSKNDYRLIKSSNTINLVFTENWKITFGDDKCLKPYAIHWHWGSNNNQGSGHHLNGKKYPLEGHLVSFNCEKYRSYDIAKDSENGLYVIAVFYKIGNSNHALETVLSSIQSDFWKTNSSTNLVEIELFEILPKQLDKYYQYDGSLTTPPCTENVKWTILNEELTVSESQLEDLRKLKFDPPNTGNLMDNFRPIIPNPNNERPIYISFKSGMIRKMRVDILLLEIIIIFFLILNQY